jgi:2-dehydro-3-deoxyphosphogalactonate aldolase
VRGADVTWDEILRDRPLIAILRGITPDEVAETAEAICDAGFKCLEVPLNSPSPLESIRRIRDTLGARAMIGAGTVLTAEAVAAAAHAGAQIVISPNTDEAVIAATRQAGMISLPGFSTPSEALRAIDAGADGLKLFPAEAAGPQVLKAIKAVLPPDMPVFPVGGITAEAMRAFRAAGAAGFGIGGALYQPGATAEEVAGRAQAFVKAWSEAAP